MVNAQEWLDQNYPIENRSKVSELDLSNKDLERAISLHGFYNLKVLNISHNKLTSFDYGNAPLEVLIVNDNQLSAITGLVIGYPTQTLKVFIVNNNPFLWTPSSANTDFSAWPFLQTFGSP